MSLKDCIDKAGKALSKQDKKFLMEELAQGKTDEEALDSLANVIRAEMLEIAKQVAIQGGEVLQGTAADRYYAQSKESQIAEDQKWSRWTAGMTSTGKVQGAPQWVNRAEDPKAALRKMERMLVNRIQEGETGRFWYEDSAKAVMNLVGDDVREAERFIQLIAIYSPQANVQVNTSFAVKAWNQFKRNDPIDVKTGDQDAKATAVLYGNEAFDGRKTNSFYQNLVYELINQNPKARDILSLDQEVIDTLDKPATIDMWMYRAFEYDNEAAADDKGSGAYSFSENYLRRITAKLNKRLPEGGERWTPHQVQAAIWTSMKARYETDWVKTKTNRESLRKGYSFIPKSGKNKGKLMRKSDKKSERAHRKIWNKWARTVTAAEATEMANTTAASFETFIDQMTEAVTWETMPSTKLGLAINNAAPEVQQQFHREALQIIVDESGTDMLAEMLGVPLNYVRLSEGGYEGQVNENYISHLVPEKGEKGFDRDAVRAYARAIQYIFRQDAVPWFRADPRALLSKAARDAQMFRVINTENGRTISKGKFQTLQEAQDRVAEKGEGFEIRGGPYAQAVALQSKGKLSHTDIESVLNLLQEAFGTDAGLTVTGPNEISVVNFRDDQTGVPFISDEAFEAGIESIEDGLQALGFVDGVNFWSEGEYGHYQDYEADPTGEAILSQEGISGRPDLQAWLRDRRAQMDALTESYSARNLEKRKIETRQIEYLAQSAYHATGESRTYDKFSTEYVGGGKGVGQFNFGWGLYFSDSAAIANRYLEMLQEDRGDEGALYMVNLLPAEDEYLLWDVAVDRQPQHIQDRIVEITGRPIAYYQGIGFNGGDIYNMISRKFQSDKAASLDLLAVGIKGVKYRDASNRDYGHQSHNYVIFDDQHVEMVDRLLQSGMFYSALERAAKQLQKKGSGQQLLAQLKKMPGVKAEELEWLGVEDYLAGKESITRDELVQFIQVGGVRIDETTLGLDPRAMIEDMRIDMAQATADASLALTKEDLLGFETVQEAMNAIRQHTDWADRWEIVDPANLDTIKRFVAKREDFEKRRGQAQPTKYENYTLPGGTDYRELLLTLPATQEARQLLGGEPTTYTLQQGADIIGVDMDEYAEFGVKEFLIYPSNLYIMIDKDGNYYAEADGRDMTTSNLAEAEEWVVNRVSGEGVSSIDNNDVEFRNSHFDRPNIIGHVRFKTREIDGKNTLFIEEVQSDWHQAGRKEGYAAPGAKKEMWRRIEDLDVAMVQIFSPYMSENIRPLEFKEAQVSVEDSITTDYSGFIEMTEGEMDTMQGNLANRMSEIGEEQADFNYGNEDGTFIFDNVPPHIMEVIEEEAHVVGVGITYSQVPQSGNYDARWVADHPVLDIEIVKVNGRFSGMIEGIERYNGTDYDAVQKDMNAHMAKAMEDSTQIWSQIREEEGSIWSNIPQEQQVVLSGMMDERDAMYTDWEKMSDRGVPDAPFKKTWPTLMMKRMIRYAVENNFDQIAWTTGDQQAKRYGGDADRAGMIGFYDQMLPNMTRKYIKKMGADVAMVPMEKAAPVSMEQVPFDETDEFRGPTAEEAEWEQYAPDQGQADEIRVIIDNALEETVSQEFGEEFIADNAVERINETLNADELISTSDFASSVDQAAELFGLGDSQTDTETRDRAIVSISDRLTALIVNRRRQAGFVPAETPVLDQLVEEFTPVEIQPREFDEAQVTDAVKAYAYGDSSLMEFAENIGIEGPDQQRWMTALDDIVDFSMADSEERTDALVGTAVDKIMRMGREGGPPRQAISAEVMAELEGLLDRAYNEEEGSDEQITAENTLFARTEEIFGIDWQDEPHAEYLSRASTDERIDYVKHTVNPYIEGVLEMPEAPTSPFTDIFTTTGLTNYWHNWTVSMGLPQISADELSTEDFENAATEAFSALQLANMTDDFITRWDQANEREANADIPTEVMNAVEAGRGHDHLYHWDNATTAEGVEEGWIVLRVPVETEIEGDWMVGTLDADVEIGTDGQLIGVGDLSVGDWQMGDVDALPAPVPPAMRPAVAPPPPMVHAFDITEKMRETAMQGQALFQDRDDTERGRYFPKVNDERVIQLTQASDLSSFLHESGHLFLDIQRTWAEKYGMTENQRAMLNWLGVNSFADIGVEHHERWAETFEVYLREGKAPSIGLRRAFASFARWLKRIYATLSDPRLTRAELAPEIKDIFDRMLATQAEIEESAATPPYTQLFRSKEQAGMTDAQWAEYVTRANRIKDTAEMTLDEKVMAEYKKQKSDEWKREKAPMIQEEKDRLSTEREYQLMGELVVTRRKDGTKDNSKLMDYHKLKSAVGEIPRGKFIGKAAGGGVDPAVYAERYGYPSVQAMYEDINSKPTINEAADAAAESRMKQKHGDILNDGSIEAEVQEALVNEDQAAMLMMELKAAKKKEGWLGDVTTPGQKMNRGYLRTEAERLIASMTFKEVKPHKYYNQMIKAAKAAARGQDVMQNKIQQLANHYLYKSALKAKQDMEKRRKQIKAVQNRKYNPQQVDQQYIEQMKMLANMYDMRKPAKERMNYAAHVLDWYAAQVEPFDKETGLGNPHAELINLELLDPNLIRAIQHRVSNGGSLDGFVLKGFDELTGEEIHGVTDMLQHLRHVGGEIMKAGAAEKAEVRDQGTASILANGGKNFGVQPDQPRPFDSPKLVWSSIINAIPSLGNMVRKLDGFQDDGWAFRNIFMPINEAVATKFEMQEQMHDMLDKYMGNISTVGLSNSDGRDFTAESGQTRDFSSEEIFMMATYWGTESSRAALMAGHNLTEGDVMKLMQRLTPEQLMLVNSVWAMNESQWPALQKAAKAMLGTAPPKLTATPFVVNGIQMKGGHMQLMYASVKTELKDEQSRGMNTSNVVPIRAGSTHQRKGGGGKPVKLQVANIVQSVEEKTHYIAFAEVGRHLRSLVNNDEITDAIVQKHGEKFYKNFVHAIQGITSAQPAIETNDGLASLSRYMRGSATMMHLAYSIRNVVQQFGAVPIAAKEVGSIRFMQASALLLNRPRETVALVNTKSKFMQNRGQVVNREAREYMKKVMSTSKGARMWESLKSHGFIMQTAVDMTVAYPTWYAKYTKGIEQHGDERRAIIEADTAVAESVGSGADMHLGRIMQSNQNEFVKTLTVFGSWFNAYYQRLYRSSKGGTDYLNAGFLADGILLPIIVANLTQMLIGDWPDEDEEWWEYGAKNSGLFLAGTMPLVRDIGSLLNGFTPTAPLGAIMASPVRIWNEVSSYRDDNQSTLRMLADVGRATGQLVKIPGQGNLWRFLDYWDSWLRGDEGDFFNPYQAFTEGRNKDR